MTKARPALSTEAALDLVIGVLTMDRACEATNRKPHYLRALSDPDKPDKLSIDDAVALDLAYVQAGHQGTPIYDSIGLRLRTACELDLHTAAVLTNHATAITREGSEAVIALLEASASGPARDKATLRRLLKELVDDQRAVEDAIRTVNCMIEHGAPCAEDAAPP